ncbi:alpha/beta fold hydrolase [Variovorax dokdonensis]|uniref:Alpha/beta fold hydrolase n=1 Tax=Variovorax dokdonensis TaxID=344883 RepID=A0ABT7NDZ4_9BURK|nr:alpha/beta fold hydrolase [Variovorax dokdonensis]MDM0046170.1 alpha/beta fold hydrolase [Variovorax dokdonensis]
MPEVRNARHMVLVHGAWQGSWSFATWRPFLEAAGWTVHAVDLPGNGWGEQGAAPASLDTYTAHVADIISAIDAPVVLVGHSGGGVTISQVAERMPDRVAALVYLAGMMLPSAMSYGELLGQVALEHPGVDLRGVGSWLDWDEGRTASTVREEGALLCFVQDCEIDAARKVATLLRAQPESGRAMRNTLSAEHFGRVPRIYVECSHDQSVLLPIQQHMQKLSPGAVRVVLDCGHVPQLAQPERLTALLLPHLEPLVNAARGEPASI